MEPIELAIRKEFLPALFGGEDMEYDLIEILGNAVERGGVIIPEPRKSAERDHVMSVEVLL